MPRTRQLQAPRRYQPRALETLLYRTVARELGGFLADAEHNRHLPGFVRQTFADFLGCGDPANGFVHLRCTACKHERAVALSCKRRGVCASCAGRGMNEVAEHLTDNVLPYEGIRQWVLTLPYSLRYRLAYDRTLVGPLLDAFIRSIFAALRRRARERHALGRHVNLQPGAINLNVHFHTLVLDGVYAVDTKVGTIEFLPLPAPSYEEVLDVLTDTARRIARRLQTRGLGDNDDPDQADPLARLCRYTARPAVAVERLRELPNGRLAYALRHTWHDGTTHVVFEPRELMARLAAQIPPPRAHQLRYHGILGPAAAYRDEVVARRDRNAAEDKKSVPAITRPSWAVLLQRTFAVDALACPRCGASMRPVGIVTDARNIDTTLARLASARAP